MQFRLMAIAFKWRLLLTIAGSLLIGVSLSNPARAYEGIFEMFGRAFSGANQEEAPPVPDTALNPWQPYNQGSLVTAAKYQRLGKLKLPQRRETLDRVIGSPRQTNYVSVYGYEDHRLYDGRTLEITYQNGTDQRGHAGWVAVAVEVR